MKKFLLFSLLTFLLFGCTELQQVVNQFPNTGMGGMSGVSEVQISNGLKQALEFGVQDGVNVLGQKDGYFGNQMVKIMLPQELQSVDRTLRNIGLGSLADEGLKMLNRAAEDAVKEATPIFINAITTMTISDASGILMGGQGSATRYLEGKTTTQLITAFQPKVQNSLGKVGADAIWEQIITQYNTFTGQKVTPDLNSYVTQQAVNGLFLMVAEKENGIRGNISQRTTPLLMEVFRLQD